MLKEGATESRPKDISYIAQDCDSNYSGGYDRGVMIEEV